MGKRLPNSLSAGDCRLIIKTLFTLHLIFAEHTISSHTAPHCHQPIENNSNRQQQQIYSISTIHSIETISSARQRNKTHYNTTQHNKTGTERKGTRTGATISIVIVAVSPLSRSLFFSIARTARAPSHRFDLAQTQ